MKEEINIIIWHIMIPILILVYILSFVIGMVCGEVKIGFKEGFWFMKKLIIGTAIGIIATAMILYYLLILCVEKIANMASN